MSFTHFRLHLHAQLGLVVVLVLYFSLILYLTVTVRALGVNGMDGERSYSRDTLEFRGD